MTSQGKSFNILHIEDNPGDIRLLREAINSIKDDSSCDLKIDVSCDSKDIIKRLTNDRWVKQIDLVVINMGLPGIDGMEVLKRIKADPELKHILVIVFDVIENSQDAQKLHELGANWCIEKQPNFSMYAETCEVIKSILPSVVSQEIDLL